MHLAITHRMPFTHFFLVVKLLNTHYKIIIAIPKISIIKHRPRTWSNLRLLVLHLDHIWRLKRVHLDNGGNLLVVLHLVADLTNDDDNETYKDHSDGSAEDDHGAQVLVIDTLFHDFFGVVVRNQLFGLLRIVLGTDFLLSVGVVDAIGVGVTNETETDIVKTVLNGRVSWNLGWVIFDNHEALVRIRELNVPSTFVNRFRKKESLATQRATREFFSKSNG